MWYYLNTFCQSDYMAHYGVKGMKWGVRRSKEELKYNRSSIEAVVNRMFSKNEIYSPAGFRLTGISTHALDRIEFGGDHGEDRKVTAKEIIDAVKNPIHYDNLKYDELGRPRQTHIGNKASVGVNPVSGLITTVWPTGTKTRKKYGG